MKQQFYKPAIMIILAASILLLSCAKQPAHFAFIDFFLGRVEVLKADKKIEPAAIKKPLFRDDRVKTYEKSTAFIQCGADNLTQVFENTEVRLDTLPARLDSSAGETAFELVRGKASFFIEKLSSSGSFQVKVLAVRAAVRGTLFHAARDGDVVVFMVKEGALAVSSEKKDFEEFVLEAGKKAVIEGKEVKIVPLGMDDQTRFRDIAALCPLAGIGCTPPEYVDRFFRRRLGLAPAETKEPVKGEKAALTEEKPGKEAAVGEKAPAAKARLLVIRLAPNGVEPAEAEEISRKIYNGILAARGSGQVVYRAAGDKRSANRLLSGRVSRLGQSRVIAVNVVDGEKGTVLYNKTATVREDDQMDGQIQAIAREVAALGVVWR